MPRQMIKRWDDDIARPGLALHLCNERVERAVEAHLIVSIDRSKARAPCYGEHSDGALDAIDRFVAKVI